MKKCVCISCFDYYSTRIHSIAGYYVNSGYEVSYLIPNYNHFEKAYYSVNYPSIKTIQLPIISYKGNISVERLLSHWLFAKKVFKELKRINPDVIYCIVPPNSLFMRIARYKTQNPQVKVIFDVYDRWPESFPYEKYATPLQLPFKFWKMLRNKYIDCADLIVTVSSNGQSFLKKIVSGTKIKVLKPAVMPQNIAYNSNVSNGLTFCYLGLISHIVNIELGERLFGELSKKCPVILHIIGAGENHDTFVQRLKAVGVKVVSHGAIFNTEKKNEIFSKCNLGICIPKPEVMSTMPLKAVEYLSVGLPFITTACGDIMNDVEQYNLGINVTVEDIQGTADKIARLKEAELKKMHRNCVEFYANKYLPQNLDAILGIE